MLQKIVLASGNAGKIYELQTMLANHPIEVLPQSAFNVPEAEETGMTFIENAILKARNACKYSGLPSIADDSGLEVDALRGAPGIYSARYAGQPTSDQANNQKLLDALAMIPTEQRTARYHCAIAYLQHEHDPTPLIVEGRWEGRILTAPQGDQGFGYDPLFYIASLNKTAAQLDKITKNKLSHRGQAIAQFIENITPNC